MFLEKVRSKWSKSILIAVVLQLLLFKVVATAAAHQHTLPDGRIIIHSHLAAGSTNNNTQQPKHHHTEFELCVIHLFTGLHLAILAAVFFGILLTLLVYKREELLTKLICYCSISTPSLRAPPVFN